MASERVYTWEEVEQHNSVSAGVWLVFKDGVYDVTQFLDEHPGGEDVLLDNSGKNATNPFLEVGHSEDAVQLRERYRIGRIGTAEPSPPEQSSRRHAAAAVVAAGFVVLPTAILTVAAVAIGIYLVYRRYKK